MGCHYPLTAWKSRDIDDIGPTGKVKMVFREDLGYPNTKTELPCGQCIGCRLDRARGWAARCLHEASLHPQNCFVTLTYKENPYSLNREHIPQMIKRLRDRNSDIKIRFFQCGEYGEQFMRPHHHVLFFNYFPKDARYFKRRKDNRIYVSKELSEVWPHGMHEIGELTYDSACYTAKYCLKKIGGEKAEDHYQGRQPEYTSMSLRPGIGKDWFDKYQEDLYTHDRMVMPGGYILRPPKYYDRLYESDNPTDMRTLKIQRRKNASLNPENCEERREVKSQLAKLKEKAMKKRLLEQGG